VISQEDDRLRISGPVTLENAMELRKESEQYFRSSSVLVDFSNAEEIDSAAISLMLEWLRNARAAGRDVRFTNLGESITSLVDLYGVTDLIPVDAAQAKSALSDDSKRR
jgi:phospholipid transport system transporter-binding protein